MKRLTATRAFFLSMMTVAAITWAQQKVDQGKPGNQGPWPVTISGSGSGGLTVTEAPCAYPLESIIQFDGGAATPCPVVSRAGRRLVTMCNSPKNSGTPSWTVRADGVAPTVLVSSPGQSLRVGDCVLYFIAATLPDAGVPLNCISDTNSAALTITECL